MTGEEQALCADGEPRPAIYVRAGALEVRCARDAAEMEAAQRLRYRIFYEEMAARPTPAMRRQRRDMDAYDPLCDHLLVLDHARPADERVVGTYRLLREEVALRHSGFYSSQEYDLSPLMSDGFRSRMRHQGQLLELGRSCVHRDYRTNTTISLLWKGIASYLYEHNIAYLFGCASLPGTDPEPLRLPLAYLYHHHLCPPEFRVRAVPGRHVPMDRLPATAVDVRAARRALPPLIKGYLRLGCFIGDGAVVDHQFGTTDVFILLPVERVTRRYSERFGTPRIDGNGGGFDATRESD
ncbi:MAG: GNAT family N-acetyltransferase [Alphaproteobacteria bacterium]|nr:MAG: GNAT family N-acetyltransferase [Alphaproteobacteria bacterium]